MRPGGAAQPTHLAGVTPFPLRWGVRRRRRPPQTPAPGSRSPTHGNVPVAGAPARGPATSTAPGCAPTGLQPRTPGGGHHQGRREPCTDPPTPPAPPARPAPDAAQQANASPNSAVQRQCASPAVHTSAPYAHDTSTATPAVTASAGNCAASDQGRNDDEHPTIPQRIQQDIDSRIPTRPTPRPPRTASPVRPLPTRRRAARTGSHLERCRPHQAVRRATRRWHLHRC